MSELVTGDDVAIPVTLRKDGATFSIDSGATIKASLISYAKDEIFITPQDVAEGTAGSDWANSLVIVEFVSADTLAIPQTGKAKIEIQVDDGGKLTWFTTIDVELGTIS